MAELADALASGASGRKAIEVRIFLGALSSFSKNFKESKDLYSYF